MNAEDEVPKLLNWLGGCDGPSVFLPGEILFAWEGGDPPSGGRVVEAVFRCNPQEQEVASDYDKACDLSYAWFGTVFRFEESTAFVPQGGEQIAIVKFLTPEPILLLGSFGWEEELDGSSVLALRKAVSEDTWQPLGEMEVGKSGRIYYFHAASPGKEWKDSIEDGGFIEVNPGKYLITATRLSPEKFLIRWKLNEE